MDSASIGAAEEVVPAESRAEERPLRIALLGYRSNPYSGGQGIYLSQLARALARLGHSVEVVSGPPYPELDPGIRLVRIPSLDLYAAPNHVTALRPRHLLSATDAFEYFSMLSGGFPEPFTFGRRVAHWLGRERRDYDVIHDNQSLCYGLLALQDRGYPVVSTIHHPVTSDRDIALAHARNWRERLLIRRWHAFVAMQTRVVRRLPNLVTVSGRARTDVARAFGIPAEQLRVVYNGIDTERFRPLPDVPRRGERIMAVASADTPLKGVDYLLEAFARLAASRPELELVVVGRLKRGGATERRLGALGLGERVRFLHGVPHDALVRLYAEATLAVVPSLYEGFGLPARRRGHGVRRPGDLHRRRRAAGGRGRRRGARTGPRRGGPGGRHRAAARGPRGAPRAGRPWPPARGRALQLGRDRAPHDALVSRRHRPDPRRVSLETVDVARLRLGPGARVLDLGCGEGRHALAAYLAADAHVVALDPAPADLATARERYAEFRDADRDAAVSFVRGSGLALPFADGSFDAIVCAEVLEHVHDYRRVLAEIARVLRAGGRLAVSVPRYGPERVCWWLSDAYHEVDGGHVRIFRARALERDVNAAGMDRFARHWAHALHVPYWWLRCLFWPREDAWPVRAWHRLLVWDLMRRPALTRGLEALANPLFGKSVVLYFVKGATR